MKSSQTVKIRLKSAMCLPSAITEVPVKQSFRGLFISISNHHHWMPTAVWKHWGFKWPIRLNPRPLPGATDLHKIMSVPLDAIIFKSPQDGDPNRTGSNGTEAAVRREGAALKASCDRTQCEPAALADGLAGQMFLGERHSR